MRYRKLETLNEPLTELLVYQYMNPQIRTPNRMNKIQLQFLHNPKLIPELYITLISALVKGSNDELGSSELEFCRLPGG